MWDSTFTSKTLGIPLSTFPHQETGIIALASKVVERIKTDAKYLSQDLLNGRLSINST